MKNNMIKCLLSVFITIVVLAGCQSIEVQENAESGNIDKHFIQLADENEPGQRLILYGKVLDITNKKAIPGARIYLYHADANGEYLPTDPNDESTAKLSGEVITDKNGQFQVNTIIPREYDQPGNKHIHLHYVLAEGFQQSGGVILFDYDVNDEVRAWAIETGFGKIIDVIEKDGVMEGKVEIELTPN